jgi:hypothetical protein
MKNIFKKFFDWLVQCGETIYKYRKSQFKNYY